MVVNTSGSQFDVMWVLIQVITKVSRSNGEEIPGYSCVHVRDKGFLLHFPTQVVNYDVMIM